MPPDTEDKIPPSLISNLVSFARMGPIGRLLLFLAVFGLLAFGPGSSDGEVTSPILQGKF